MLDSRMNSPSGWNPPTAGSAASRLSPLPMSSRLRFYGGDCRDLRLTRAVRALQYRVPAGAVPSPAHGVRARAHEAQVVARRCDSPEV